MAQGCLRNDVDDSRGCLIWWRMSLMSQGYMHIEENDADGLKMFHMEENDADMKDASYGGE